MEQAWSMYAKKADFFAIGEKFHIDPVIARVIRNRDVIGDENIEKYLHGDLSSCYDPALMKDMDKGGEIMLSAIRSRKKIRIISDYDVDGVMSNYILYMGLSLVWDTVHQEKDSSKYIDYDIPHRIYDGYGVNVRMIDKAKEEKIDLIITCDNGIAAFDAIERAKKLGMQVIVTDHHDIPYDIGEEQEKKYKIVPGDAVIDHKQVDCEYPFKELCGAGIVYKFIQYLYRISGIPEKNVEAFIEYLGIATVCDVMDLEDENRIFVRIALKKLSKTTNKGLAALLRFSNLYGKNISSYHLGFVVGPCINAMGRLDDATESLKFLLEKDSYNASQKASILINTNNDRKFMTLEGTNKAEDMIENPEKYNMAKELGTADHNQKVLVIYLQGLHESLAGIVAGRIREKYYRPVLVFTDGEDNSVIKGSGRSIPGYNMYEELNKCKNYLEKFGGHEMAAGFSMKKNKLADFRTALNLNCSLNEKELTPKLYIDVPMPINYVNLSLTRQLSLLEPFGKGNEKPVFAQSGVRIIKASVMGKNKNVLKVVMDDGDGDSIEGINFDPDSFISSIKQWFGDNECDRMFKGMSKNVVLDVAYYPDINQFGDRENLQLKLLEYRKHSI